jgi:hypothetical protein
MKRMFRAWLLVVVFVLAGLHATPARACGNAVTFSEDASIAKLREAEEALDEGDVRTARELSAASLAITSTSPMYTFAHNRGLRIHALSFVRDPSASQEDIATAVEELETRAKALRDANLEPSFAADLGEALERAGRDEDALATLVPLAERDLIGSAYAYAALHRAAKHRGDTTLASNADARCRSMAIDARMCNGEYPKQPLLRGKLSGYLLPGFVFLGAALFAAFKRRKNKSKNKTQEQQAPWSSFRAPFFATIIAIAGIASFANARTVWLATMIAIAAALIVPLWQRRAFLANARRGRVPGFHVRAAEGEIDARTPILRLFFGPKVPETLERLVDPHYRESARSPVMRLGRRSLRAAWVITAIVVGLLFAGCTSMVFLTSRSTSAKSVRVHDVFSPEE